MSKEEFVKLCAEKANLTQKDMKEVLAAVGECIVIGMRDEGGVAPFVGFKFYREYKEPHVKRNPATGGTVNVPGQYYAKVRLGGKVKEAVN